MLLRRALSAAEQKQAFSLATSEILHVTSPIMNSCSVSSSKDCCRWGEWSVVSHKGCKMLLRRVSSTTEQKQAFSLATSEILRATSPMRISSPGRSALSTHATSSTCYSARQGAATSTRIESHSSGNRHSSICLKRKSPSSSDIPTFGPQQKRQRLEPTSSGTTRTRRGCRPISFSEHWLPDLSLKGQHRRELMTRAWLGDELIDAVHTLLRRQFPEYEGLQGTFLGPINGFQKLPGDSFALQILHNGKGHWVAVRFDHERVSLYDRLNIGLTPSLVAQNSCLSPSCLEVTLPKVQHQRGSGDCGVFAIAFTVELAFGVDPRQVFYDQALMRDHLEQCLEEGVLCPFPRKDVKNISSNEICKTEKLELRVNG